MIDSLDLQWTKDADITQKSGAPRVYTPLNVTPASPSTEVRLSPFVALGILRVIYRCNDDKHIHEIRLENGTWQHADLTAISTNNCPPAHSSPISFNTPGPIPRVVFISQDNHTCELRLESSWIYSDLTQISIGKTRPNSAEHINPFAYVSYTDDIPRVLYVGDNGHIIEIRLEKGKWWNYDITQNSSAPEDKFSDPFAIAPDAISRIYFINENHHINEIRLENNTWQYADITAATINGWPLARKQCTAYSFSGFGASSERVLYVDDDSYIHEVRLEQGHWIESNLTGISTGGTWLAQYVPYGIYDPNTHAEVFFPAPASTFSSNPARLVLEKGTLAKETWQGFLLPHINPQTAGTDAIFPCMGPETNNTLYVFYIATDGHIHEISASFGPSPSLPEGPE